MDIKLFIDIYDSLMMVVVDRVLIFSSLPKVYTGKLMCIQAQDGLLVSLVVLPAGCGRGTPEMYYISTGEDAVNGKFIQLVNEVDSDRSIEIAIKPLTN